TRSLNPALGPSMFPRRSCRAKWVRRRKERPAAPARAKMKTVLVGLAFLLLATQMPLGSAQELSPEALVKQITADVLDAIHKDKALQTGDRNKALALAE